MSFRALATFAALVILMGTSAFSQAVNGTLVGTVTDASGAVVPNAKVVITETNTGTSRTTVTSESGNYNVANLPPGTYRVSVEQTGFKRSTRENIELQINSSPRVDLVLQAGNITETVEVSAAAPALQTDRADTGAIITSTQTANLPLGTNRNFQGLLNLVPGTTRASFQHSQFFNAVSSLQTQVNGQFRQGNNNQIEGIDNNQRTGLLQILIPPIEAIETVAVTTSNFDAELGRASGAVTNVQLKSGTNQIHGSAYEFFRNSRLNARNFFDTAVGKQSYNYFGGNIGAPIIKNKWFIFGDYLKVFDRQRNTNRLSIPASDFRTGNFTRSTTVIYDPATGNPDGTGRTPFPNNIIPASRINPIATRILNLVPAPNLAGDTNNYFALLPFKKDTDSYDIKSDYNITDRDRVSVRYSYARPVVFQAPIFGAAGGAAQGAFQGTGIQNTYSTGVNYNRVWTPTLVMELRAGVAHYSNVAQNTDYGTKASDALGIPGVNLDDLTSGLVGINLNGGFSNPLVGYSASLPWRREETNFNIVNSWTKTWSNHTFKFGVDYRRIRDLLLQGQTFSLRGVYSFADGQTSTPGARTSFANNIASLLLALPNQAGRDLAPQVPEYRANQFFTYVQDNWVVNSKLTLNLGLRWEFYPPGTPPKAGGFSNYNFANNTLEVAGVGSVPSNLGIVTRYSYFAPRFGMAYRLNEKTVVRGGFGISYTPFPDNTYAYNFPVRANNAYNPAVASYGPALLPDGRVASFQNGFPAAVLPVVPTTGIITNPDVNVNYFTINKNYKNPSVQSWNFAIQRSLPLKLTLDVTYVGNHGVASPTQYDLNAVNDPLQIGKGNAGRPQAFLKRNASTTLFYSGNSTMYHALQVKLDRRFSKGLTLTTSYTYGKGLGFQNGDNGNVLYYINFRRNYARNDFDRTHTFVQSYVYDLPFGKSQRFLNSGVASRVVGGWRVNGVLTLMTGTPLNINYSSSSLNTPGNSNSPNQIAEVTTPKGINVGNEWFSRGSFVVPAANTFGNVGRNSLSGPGFYNLDASLFKLVNITERLNAELRLETFGVTNTPQFSNPGTTLGNANFGYVTGASGGRQVQLGLKINF